MHIIALEMKGQTVLEVLSSGAKLESEQDMLDLIAASHEHQSALVLMSSESLSERFFDLKTGLAGMVLQKCINYHLKLAVVLPEHTDLPERFREMALEARKGKDFRFLEDRDLALGWLLS